MYVCLHCYNSLFEMMSCGQYYDNIVFRLLLKMTVTLLYKDTWFKCGIIVIIVTTEGNNVRLRSFKFWLSLWLQHGCLQCMFPEEEPEHFLTGLHRSPCSIQDEGSFFNKFKFSNWYLVYFFYFDFDFLNNSEWGSRCWLAKSCRHICIHDKARRN